MSTSSTSIKSSSGILAMLTMLSLIVFGYAYFLTEAGDSLDYQAAALAPAWYMFKPVSVLRLISEGGYLGTLAAVFVGLVHAVFYAALVFSAGTLLLGRYFQPRNRQTAEAEDTALNPAQTGLFPCEIEGSTIMVMIPPGRNPKTGELIEGIHDTNPFNQIFLRCDRAPVETPRPAETPIEKLQLAIHEILRAHPTVPASVGHHHADSSLLEHSIAISKVVVAYIRENGWEEPLARVAGLAHDLDKLLAYQEKAPGTWVKRKDATHHNTFSAYLVAQQPEFKLLDHDDQFTLTMALRYYHHPSMLPKAAGTRCERLLQAIRHADGNVIRAEKTSGIAAAKEQPNTVELVAVAVERFLQSADINSYMGGHNAHGWTKDAHEFVIVPMSRFLETLGRDLPGELARQLQLNVDTRSFGHQAIPVVQDALKSLNLLMTINKGVDSRTGMWDVKIGVKTFKACVLLDKDRISELVPTIVPKWGTTEYGVRVLKPTADKMHGDDEDAQA